MESKIHFAGICGSLRKGSFNRAVLRAAGELLPEDVTMDIVSFAEIPIYNADNDLPDADQRPEPVRQFRQALAKADALVIVSPEYNFGIPGGLKNAIDWASRGEDSPLLHKPVALMGATPGKWGTVRMQTAFLSIYLYMDMKPVYKPEIFISNAKEKIDENGKLTDDKTRKLISKKLEALKAVCIQELAAAH